MEIIYCANVLYVQHEFKWDIKELKILEETPKHLIVQNTKHDHHTFLIKKEDLNQLHLPYYTTKLNALVRLKKRIEENLNSTKVATQRYQEMLYDIEKEM